MGVTSMAPDGGGDGSAPPPPSPALPLPLPRLRLRFEAAVVDLDPKPLSRLPHYAALERRLRAVADSALGRAVMVAAGRAGPCRDGSRQPACNSGDGHTPFLT